MRRFVQAFASVDDFPAPFPREVALGLIELPDRYNIGTRGHAGVVLSSEDRAVVGDFRWGLVPRWSKEPDTKYTTVTARLDRAAKSRIYRQAWEARHCIVPMNGYYKWDRTVSPAVPYFIQQASGATLLAAGLWEKWGEEGDTLCSFTILTRPNAAIPKPMVADGPTFLAPEQSMAWIDGRSSMSASALQGLRQPSLEAYPVSRAIRDPKRDDYTLVEPMRDEELDLDTQSECDDDYDEDD